MHFVTTSPGLPYSAQFSITMSICFCCLDCHDSGCILPAIASSSPISSLFTQQGNIRNSNQNLLTEPISKIVKHLTRSGRYPVRIGLARLIQIKVLRYCFAPVTPGTSRTTGHYLKIGHKFFSFYENPSSLTCSQTLPLASIIKQKNPLHKQIFHF
jgi:hypothetical protein